MLRTIDYAALDDDTKAYLREVRNRDGAGAPGVFHAAGDSKPVLALLVGLIVLPLFVWAGYSSNKAAWANAMLQTAGVLLGGWLILYAVRRWTANPDKYVGKFFYFDPEHVFVGEGDQLRYAELDDETEAAPVGANAVRFETTDSRFDVTVPTRAVAVAAANFYDALGHLRADESGRWGRLSPAESGAVARYMLRNDQEPRDLNEVDLDVERIPEEVRPRRGGGLGFLRYPLILAVGAAVFFAFFKTNAPLQDNGNFAAAKDGGPAKLRDYLLNPHNAAHRDEVTKLLAQQYDAPIAAVREKATDAELREGFVKLLDSLRGPDTPSVSVRVTDSNPAALSNWARELRQRIGDGVGNVVGKDHIVVVRAPGDPDKDGTPPPADEVKKPAHIEVSYSSLDPDKLTWTLELRLKPDDPSPYLKVFREYKTQPGMPHLAPTEAVYRDLMTRMVGTAPAAPPPLPPDDNW